MDSNGTRHHLFLGERDWERCADSTGRALKDVFAEPLQVCAGGGRGLGWNAEQHEVTLRPCIEEFRTRPGDRLPAIGSRQDPRAPSDRRGAARDMFDNFYWIAENRAEVLVLSAGSGRVSRFWPAADDRDTVGTRYGEFGPREQQAPAAPPIFSGLAVTDDHHLVVGTAGPGGLLIFDLHAGGDPHQVCWPEDSFSPFDIAAREQGGVWVLDRARGRCWMLDRHFHVLFADGGEPPPEPPRELFQPAGAAAPRRALPRDFPAGVILDAAADPGAADPIAIEPIGADEVLVLDRNPSAAFSRVIHYRPGAPPTLISLERFRLIGHDMAFVPSAAAQSDALLGRLFIVSASGNQTFEFDVTRRDRTIALNLISAYRPMRLFGGKGLIASRGLVFYDFANGWVPLAEQRRPRFAIEGTAVTPPLDGREPDCVWHRLTIDACIPPGTDVVVSTRTANERHDLGSAPWFSEPRLYLRGNGSEQPFAAAAFRRHRLDARAMAAGAATGEPLGAGTWEILFQRARGRYIQIRLTLGGDGRRSPRVRAMRAYYPRFSYLAQYLPGVYREDPDSASFLDRFLSNVEGFYTSLEDRIAAAQLLWDVRSAPPEALPWLASWLGVALDPAWDDRRRRLFIRHAMEVFRWRGTTRGLLIAAGLALDPCVDDRLFTEPAASSAANRVRIVERYRTRRLSAVALGDPTVHVGPREVQARSRWDPSSGRDELSRRYAAALRSDVRRAGDFPIVEPDDPELAAIWRRFALETLEFVPTAANVHLQRWQDFLARRYQRINAFNLAYGAASSPYASFAEIGLNTALPADGAPLADWYEFQRVLVPMHAVAHRFTVMLPVRPGTAQAQQLTDLAHVRRVIDVEKPAHTVFDVKFYWALFRLGEARLGHDTVAERGGRAPELMQPATLGQTYLAESYLTPRPPLDAADRRIVGRDRVP